MNCLVSVVGPTASGKTELALDIADKFGGEIINADSRLFYRGFDVGIRQTFPRGTTRSRHHLIDILKSI